MRLKSKGHIIKIVIFIVLIITGLITCINPIYPNEQYLQQLGTIVLLVIIFNDLNKNTLTIFSFSFFAVFIIFHIIGARYIYSYVPYTKWINSILHLISKGPISLQEGRNSYDRFVHLAFGILVFPILYEFLSLRKTHDKILLIVSAWAIIQTLSMLYELFEWGLTLVLSSEAANDYNGQQGDLWDAQKDMFLAMIGSSLMALIYLLLKRRKHTTAGSTAS
jgi:putative membrane protein